MWSYILTIRQGLDWRLDLLTHLFTPLGTTVNHEYSAINTLQITRTRYVPSFFTSLILQWIYKVKSHAEPSLHRLASNSTELHSIILMPQFLNSFLCSEAHILAGWRLETQLTHSWHLLSVTFDCRQSQSQSYFTTGGLPPVSSSWRQTPWDPRAEISFPAELLR
jgi:hypothetical protein